MNDFELEIQIGNTSCDETPVDNLIQELIAAGANSKWAYHPDGAAGLPCFRLDDKERGLVITLVCEAQTEQYCQYCLEAKNAGGSTKMRSVEWVAAGNSGSLHMLYSILSKAIQDASDRVTEDMSDDPNDDSALTDEFIDALLKDVQGNRRQIHFIRQGDDFVADSFGVSESIITLSKDWADDISTQFSIKLEKPNGDLILSCAETSKNTDEDAELRKLYQLLDESLPIVTTDIATKDVRYFIEGKAFDSFFDRVLQYALPEVAPIEPDDAEGKVLIYDIFYGVGESAVIRQFLDEVAIRKGPLSEPDYKRLKALAQSVFTIIRNTHRNPNGRIFTGRAVSVAYDKPGLASRGVRFSSCISRIANAYTTWPTDIAGKHPTMSEGRVMNKVATLILAAILADQIS